MTISFVLVVPFVILEMFVAETPLGRFPFPLFGLMWILALSFGAMVTPLARGLLRGGNDLTVLSVIPRVVLLVGVTWVWVTLVVDQMPCFLGIPNCD